MVADSSPEDILQEYLEDKYVRPQDLVIGETYLVEWTDCCVRGLCTGVFSGFQWHGGDEWAVFDNRMYIHGGASVRRLEG